MRLLLAAAALVSATSAHAVSFINGDFHMAQASQFSKQDSVPGWVALSPGIVQFGDGILLSSQNSGGVMQKVAGFTPGGHYRISFDVSGETTGTNKPNRLLVSATGGEAQIYSFGGQALRVAALSSLAKLSSSLTYDFVASGKLQNIQFRSLGNNPFGTVLSNVEISLVPEPATWALMLAGFGLVGGFVRRRNRAKTTLA